MSTAIIAAGLALVLFGALGTVLLPDLYLRLHASTKCGVTGAATVLLGLAARAPSVDAAARLVLIVVLIFATAPMIPHIIAVAHAAGRHDDAEGPSP
ncbi:MAG: monovalent cation/H(+) antiporter subunit G [Kiritimatiellae bacterium]|nr:monovalent cation/H(+) antiporter subunit G [Kiritimatiellia bacterium]